MKLRKVICLMTAVLMSACTALSAFAEDSTKSKKIEAYSIDESKTTIKSDEPTLSFDMSDWSKFVKTTKDANKINMKLKQEKSNSYQGGTLVISGGTNSNITEFPTFAGRVMDSDANLVYPKAAEEDAKHITMGAELDAKDFGMNYFDGCLITFVYRIDQSVNGKLMDNSVYVFPTDNDYSVLDSKELKITYNDSDNNNVTQYARGVIQVSENVGATKLIFETPLIKVCKDTDIMFIDNVQVTTPLWEDGKEVYVGNVDGYNSNAEPQEIVAGLQIDNNATADESTVSSADKQDNVSKTNIIIFIGAGVLVVGIVIFVLIMVRRHKNRFY